MWVCGNGSDLRATKLDNREHREELLPRPLRHLCTFLGVLSSENGELAGGGSPEEETTRDQPYYYYTERERAHETNESSRPSLVSIVIIFDYVNNRFLRRRCSSSRAANRSSTSLLDRVRRSRCKQLLLLLSPLGLVRGVFRVDHWLGTHTDEARDSFWRIRDHREGGNAGKETKTSFLCTKTWTYQSQNPDQLAVQTWYTRTVRLICWLSLVWRLLKYA